MEYIWSSSKTHDSIFWSPTVILQNLCTLCSILNQLNKQLHIIVLEMNNVCCFSSFCADLQGMMFSVMNGGNVRFHSDNPSNFTGLTVCLRVLTEQTFSIQLNFINQTHFVRLDNNILYVNGRSVSFYPFFMVPVYQEHWPWKNRCLTWESSTGMAQLWSDGKMSVRKGIARGQVMTHRGDKSMVLWKVFSDLDELLFDQFVGQVSDIYVWDRALGPQDLYNFLYYHYNLPSGNILDWHQIQYNTSGYAVLESLIFICPWL
uniref:Pentraxin (PTX) domain-containing protein n=1 Tax=Astyanax mexicanus TaxID=7994 RepID=A0A8B9JA34_ASTMX